MSNTMPQDLRERLERLYAAFNRREIDTVLAHVTEDVVWANGMEGGHVRGRSNVADYWARQFGQIRSTVEPRHWRQLADGRVAAHVHQLVRTPDGQQLLADAWVWHVFTFERGLVSRFDIAGAWPDPDRAPEAT